MKKLVLKESVVSSPYLNDHLQSDNLILLDASMASVGQNDFEIPSMGIAGARFIDWKKNFVDSESDLPNMLPNENAFTAATQNLGINTDSAIIIYDQKGVYSSPRIWWMFKTMGHDNIAILNGGFPDWKNNNFLEGPLDFGPFKPGNFVAKRNDRMITNQEELSTILFDKSSCILDARSSGRFNGTSPEPRPELRSGHIPNSASLPYTTLIKDGFFRNKEEIIQTIEGLISENTNKLIFTCGSGITASILFLAADYVGYKDLSLYDGSWSEWGLPSDFPIEK